MEDKKKLFIGNLPYSMSIEEIKEAFAKFGEITDAYKPEGKGFAFITFADESQAEAAINEMNGAELGGRKAFVSIARAKEERK